MDQNDMCFVKQEFVLGCESPTQSANTSRDSQSFLTGIKRTSDQSEDDNQFLVQNLIKPDLSPDSPDQCSSLSRLGSFCQVNVKEECSEFQENSNIVLQILDKTTEIGEILIALNKKVDKVDNKLDSLVERMDRFKDRLDCIEPNLATSINKMDKLEEILDKSNQSIEISALATYHPILDKVGNFESVQEISDFDKCIAKSDNKSMLIAFRQMLDELGLAKTPTKFITSRMNRILGEKKISGYFRPMFMNSKMCAILMDSVREHFKFDMAVSQANNSIINWFSNWGREKRQKDSKSGQSSSEEQTVTLKEHLASLKRQSDMLESPKNVDDKKSKRTRK